jgi:hypothetical protein
VVRPRVGKDLLDPGDFLELVFDLGRDETLDLLGGGAAPERFDRGLVERDVREEVDRETLEGDCAPEHDDDEQRVHQHRLTHAEAGQAQDWCSRTRTARPS